jgi:hypothetical protein
MEMPMHLPLGVLDGIAQRAWFFVSVAGAGAVQGQADEATVLESLVAFGLVQSGCQSHPRHLRVHALGAVGQGVIPERFWMPSSARTGECANHSRRKKLGSRKMWPMTTAQTKSRAGMCG